MSTNDDSQLTRDIAPFGVRMPANLKERIQTAAKSNNRSMNQEIVARLEATFRTGQQFFSSDEDVAALKIDHLAIKRSLDPDTLANLEAKHAKLAEEVAEMKKRFTKPD